MLGGMCILVCSLLSEDCAGVCRGGVGWGAICYKHNELKISWSGPPSLIQSDSAPKSNGQAETVVFIESFQDLDYER